MRSKLPAAIHTVRPTAPGSAWGSRPAAVKSKRRMCKNPRRRQGLMASTVLVRTYLLLVTLPLLALAGCRSFSQPMNLPPQVKFPLTMRLPDAHQLKAGQLVFHSDFELSADHRLVRALGAERDNVYRTTRPPRSNQTIPAD